MPIPWHISPNKNARHWPDITNSQETLFGVTSAFAFNSLRHPENHVRELFCSEMIFSACLFSCPMIHILAVDEPS